MKSIGRKHVTKILFLTTITPLSTLIASSVYAESSIYIDSGLSYINQQNLQSNQPANTTGTVTSNRSGWLLRGQWGWQQLDATGGYSINAQANLDQGLSGAGDIRAITLNGNWMQALNINWLSRINLQVSDYQDDDQPAYNNQAAGANFTLGWFGQQNSGLDFNAAWQQEQYDDNPSMAYKASRFSLGSRYYFSHRHNTPYWSIDAKLSRFDAAEVLRYSYNATSLGLAYNGWHWKKLEGNVQLLWRNNYFDETSTAADTMNHINEMNRDTNSSGMMATSLPMPENSQSTAQKDTYLTASLNLRYPLGKQWHLVSHFNMGQYRSNLADNRPLTSGFLGVSIKY